jgi:hypothetical protein
MVETWFDIFPYQIQGIEDVLSSFRAMNQRYS